MDKDIYKNVSNQVEKKTLLKKSEISTKLPLSKK